MSPDKRQGKDRRLKLRRTEDLEKINVYKELINFVDDFVFILSKDLTVEDCNQYCIDILGFSKQELIGKKISDLMNYRTECSYYSFIKAKNKNLLSVHICSHEICINSISFNVLVAKNLADLQKFKTFYENIPIMNFTVSPDGIILAVNQFGAEELGYTVEELVGSNVLNIFYPEDVEEVKKQADLCLSNQDTVYQWELRKVKKTGEIIWVRETARAMVESSGKLNIYIACANINEIKKKEEELKNSEQKYRDLIERNNDVVFTVDINGIFTYINESATKISGYSIDEIVGSSYLNIIPESHKKDINNFYINQIKQKIHTTYYEYPVTIKNGSIKWFGQNVQLLYNKDGRVVGFQSIARDITDRKLVEDRVEELLLQQSTLLNNLGIHIWYLKDPYTYGFVNRSFLEFFGFEESKVVNQKIRNVFSGYDMIDSVIQENEKVFRDGKAVIIERWITSSSGEDRLYRITKLPRSNGTTFAACWGVDITDEYLEAKSKKEKQRQFEQTLLSYFNTYDQKKRERYQKINDKISTLDTFLEIGTNIQSISHIGGRK